MNVIPLKKTRRDYERVLTAVFGLLIQCGVRERVVSAIANRALKLAIRKAISLGQSSGGELATFSLVLDAWHRDRPYLTSEESPRRCLLLGRGRPASRHWSRSEGPMFDPIDLAYRIRSLGLITPCSGNRYRPIGDTALVSIYGPTVLQHVARCLMSLLETVEDNLTGAPTSAHLLERFAEVPDLPAECVDDFQQFSRLQGAMFARTINDWLETRRARGQIAANHENVGAVRAGVHVHAYVAPTRSRMRKLCDR